MNFMMRLKILQKGKDAMAAEIILATQNENKVREFNEIAKNFNVKFINADFEFNPIENGKTFEENAYIKALCATQSAKKIYKNEKNYKKYFIADDSGLCIEHLKGAPGLLSARYDKTNELRIQKVLKKMNGVINRNAKFVCSLVLCDENGKILHKTLGTCKGKIGFEPLGQGGFGYDPIFIVDGFNGKSMAQLSEEEKNFVSHRGRALTDMLMWISLAIH